MARNKKKVEKYEIELEERTEELKAFSKDILDALDGALGKMDEIRKFPLMQLYQNLIAMDDDIKTLNDKKRELTAFSRLSVKRVNNKSFNKLVEKKIDESTKIFEEFNDKLNKKLIERIVMMEEKHDFRTDPMYR